MAGEVMLSLYLLSALLICITVWLHAKDRPWKSHRTRGDMLVLCFLGCFAAMNAFQAMTLPFWGEEDVADLEGTPLCFAQSLLHTWSVLAGRCYALMTVVSLYKKLKHPLFARIPGGDSYNRNLHIFSVVVPLVLSVSLHIFATPTTKGVGRLYCWLRDPVEARLLFVYAPALALSLFSVGYAAACLRKLWATARLDLNAQCQTGEADRVYPIAGSDAEKGGCAEELSCAGDDSESSTDALANPELRKSRVAQALEGEGLRRIKSRGKGMIRKETLQSVKIVRGVQKRLGWFFGVYGLLMVVVSLPAMRTQPTAPGETPSDAVGKLSGEELGITVTPIVMFLVWGMPRLLADFSWRSCCGRGRGRGGVAVVPVDAHGNPLES